MLPKPSLVLQVRLRPEEYSDTAAAEIKRSYMYLAQSVVSELDEGERAEGNLMRLNVRLMKPFWDASDPAAEQLWRASFMPWLVNATRNMSTAMHNYNTVLHPLGAGNVTYQWADFDFAPHAVLRLKVDDENRIPSEAPAFCDKARTLAAEGAFGENVARVRIPSRASIAAQEAAFEEEQARYRAALAAYDEARLAYEQKVLTVFKEADDAVVTYRSARKTAALKLNLRDAASKYVELAHLQYRAGSTNYIDVLDAQRRYFDAQIGLSNSVRDEHLALVQLYKALGGGWTE